MRGIKRIPRRIYIWWNIKIGGGGEKCDLYIQTEYSNPFKPILAAVYGKFVKINIWWNIKIGGCWWWGEVWSIQTEYSNPFKSILAAVYGKFVKIKIWWNLSNFHWYTVFLLYFCMLTKCKWFIPEIFQPALHHIYSEYM